MFDQINNITYKVSSPLPVECSRRIINFERVGWYDFEVDFRI